MSRPTRRPRYADVAATLALVLALGGTTAYAVQQLPKNSVGKKQLQKAAVTSNKIKDGKVKGKDLALGAVGPAQLGENAVTGAKIAPGTIGLSDMGPGSVGASELVTNAVSGSKVANSSLTLADLVGSNVAYGVNVANLASGACVQQLAPAPGAAAGQVALVSMNSADAPAQLVFGPATASAGSVSFKVCNISGSNVLAASFGVRVVTLG